MHPWDNERPCIMCELLLSGTTGNRLPHAFKSQLASRILTPSMPLPTNCHTRQAREQQRWRRASGKQEHEEDFQQQGAQPDRPADVRPAAHTRGGSTGALNGGH